MQEPGPQGKGRNSDVSVPSLSDSQLQNCFNQTTKCRKQTHSIRSDELNLFNFHSLAKRQAKGKANYDCSTAA